MLDYVYGTKALKYNNKLLTKKKVNFMPKSLKLPKPSIQSLIAVRLNPKPQETHSNIVINVRIAKICWKKTEIWIGKWKNEICY